MELFHKFFAKPTYSLYAPISGKAVPLAEVPDRSFSQGMMGRGIAIMPTSGQVFAPCDAAVTMVFPTGHAISLTTQYGAEILIHIGLDTVELGGKPFSIHVCNGDKVKKGQLLLEADLQAIRDAGLPVIAPMVICNSEDFSAIDPLPAEAVTNNDAVLRLTK